MKDYQLQRNAIRTKILVVHSFCSSFENHTINISYPSQNGPKRFQVEAIVRGRYHCIMEFTNVKFTEGFSGIQSHDPPKLVVMQIESVETHPSGAYELIYNPESQTTLTGNRIHELAEANWNFGSIGLELQAKEIDGVHKFWSTHMQRSEIE